jgi:hypothetical protein
MCCLGCLGLFAPRLVLLFVWIFTNRVTVAFSGSFIVPLIGIVFLPFTTLFYVLAYWPGHGVTGLGWLFVVFGLLLDLGSYSSSYRDRRRVPGYPGS